MPQKTVCVAMSGGVDSSVVAALLKDQGYDVIGITMQIWQESQRDPRHAGCCSLGAVEDARRVAQILDIPHYVINFKDKFKETVIDEFIEEYAAGRTPNPCVTCNKEVKFAELMTKARELGCDSLATGHYARVQKDEKTGKHRLMRAKAQAKDQSYALYMLSQDQLAYSMFPLGDLDDKAETRQISRDHGLPVSEKPDSQEICFVSEAGGYREFLKKNRPEMFEQGEMVDQEGNVLGQHDGVAGFTIGQRRGLGMAKGKPLYVLQLQPDQNKVVVGDRAAVQSKDVQLSEFQWSSGAPESLPMRVEAKVRYNMEARPAMLYMDPDPRIVFEETVHAITPGQIAVAYVDDTIVAGGKIR